MAGTASSSTSSRTSRTSFTSDAHRADSGAGPGRGTAGTTSRRLERPAFGTLVGLVRIVHPFPSLLDGVVTAALVLVAGGSGEVATRLGIAMVALQFGIGTANDLHDEPLDGRTKPGKPLPRGLLSRRSAVALLLVTLSVGLLLSALSGPLVLTVAVLGTAVGLAYDGLLKGTAWSWVPFAFGIPLLPVYAWLGATETLPAAFLVLLPTAVLAGTALAVANLLADAERDAAAGVVTLATRLGAASAWRVSALLFATVGAVAIVSLVGLRGRGVGVPVLALGLMILAVGQMVGRASQSAWRERAWELQAAGVGVLAVGWVAAVSEAGSL